MAETDFAQFEAKTSSDRTVMHVLYAMHTIAWPSLGHAGRDRADRQLHQARG